MWNDITIQRRLPLSESIPKWSRRPQSKLRKRIRYLTPRLLWALWQSGEITGNSTVSWTTRRRTKRTPKLRVTSPVSCVWGETTGQRRNPPHQGPAMRKSFTYNDVIMDDLCGPFYWHGLILIPAQVSNHIHYELRNVSIWWHYHG